MTVLLTVGNATAATLPPEGKPALADKGQNGFPAERVGPELGIAHHGRYIVVLKHSVRDPKGVAEAQADQHGFSVRFVYRFALKGYSAAGLSSSEVERLRRNPRVELVTPDRKVEAFAQTVPAGVKRISAASNPALDIDEQDDVRVDADVAVLDSGIDHTHPDLNVHARFNCVPPDEEDWTYSSCQKDTGTDGHGHGTHVAGTIGALDNGTGVVGVAPGARLWSFRVLNNEGSGWESWIVAGIDTVTSHASAIEVANMSLGGFGEAPAEAAAISASVDKGVVYAVAASNDRLNAEAVSPANHPDVITVSAIADTDGASGAKGSGNCGSDDRSYWWSNWGNLVELTAPGVCVLSTLRGGGYGSMSGTSMATPHVAGAAALLSTGSNPNTRADVEALRASMIDAGTLDWYDASEDRKVEPLVYAGAQPIEATEAATAGWDNPTADRATLYGSFNGRGSPTSYQFEYGPTASYGSLALPAFKAAGARYTTVSESIAGLQPDRTYHYRLVVKNANGTFYGPDRTLSTSRWSVESAATSPTADGEWLNDVSCLPAFCAAVGVNTGNGGGIGAYHRSGSSEWAWKPIMLSAPLTQATPEAISCASAEACTSVGQGWTDKDESVGFAARWNGTSWSSQRVPAPIGSQYAMLEDVSCPTSSFCMAVGYYKNSAGVWENYSAKWSGGAWSVLSTPNPSDSVESELDGVSCSSPSHCVTVGWYVNTHNGARSVIAKWDSSANQWLLQSPARTGYAYLVGVSCLSTTFCMAVGHHSEIWDGVSWALEKVPRPVSAGNDVAMEDVSCLHPSACTAVGNFAVQARTRGVAEVWDGTTWAAKGFPRESELRDRVWGVGCVPLVGCKTAGERTGAVSDALIIGRDDVQTGEAKVVSATDVTLTGTVNPGGSATTYYFQYGKTLPYGQRTADGNAGSGGDTIEVSQSLSELEPETTYHYRLVASNGSTTEYGRDRTFTTAAPLHRFQSSFGFPGSGAGQFKRPWGVEVDAEGNIWVADSNNHRIQKFNAKGEFVSQFGSFGTANGQFNEPLDVAFDAAGNVWVTDGGNNRVQAFSPDGQFLQKFGSGGTGNGQFTEPWGIDISPDGSIWVADARYYRVQQFYPSGGFIRKVTGFEGPRGLAVGPNGEVWVTENMSGRVHKLSTDGTKLLSFGTKGSGVGQFGEPQAIDVKPSGQVLVADRQNDDVQQFTPDGQYVGEFGAGQLVEPRGLAVAAGGVVYVSNTYKNRVEKWRQSVPVAVTQGASATTSDAATLSGTVNPDGASTTYRFEYGKTTAYGSSAPVPSASAGSGTSDVGVSETIRGLDPGTLYHYRVVATTNDRTVYGEDRTFITKSVGEQIGSIPITEPFGGSAESLARFEADWSALGWAGGANPKGAVTTSGWRALDAYPAVNGAFHEPTVADTGAGTATAVALRNDPGSAGRYFSLWLDASGSASARQGYELRFTYVSTDTYDVVLSKWQAGTRTVLATKNGYTFNQANVLALADEGGIVSVWTNTGSGHAQLLSAADSSFASGNAALEASGGSTRLVNFKVDSL